MKITRDEARRIAALAHLEFDAAALDRLAGEMTKILGYIDQLTEADGARVSSPAEDEEEARVRTPALQILRDDVVRRGIDQKAVAGNAPEFDGGFFVVPKVIE